jgi:predicted transcriptional regulator
MPEDMPEAVRSATDVVGNNVRTEILRHLSQRSRTSLELAELLQVHHASVHRHLVLLEDRELVTADVGRGRRRGQTVTWQSNPERIAEVGQLWIDYASGGD